MCGLAGIATFRLPRDAAVADPTDLVSRMVAAVAHRGPDGTSIGPNAGAVRFGFARLGLVGLANGSQPLRTPDGTLELIANGEVYNHRELAAEFPGLTLRTQSDCEILLHLYRRDGVRFLERVRGMVSVALWDRTRNLLVLARDPFGIKPLYFHVNRDRVLVASQLTALFEDPACPRRVDWETALRSQSMSGDAVLDVAAPTTFFQDVELVAAGTSVTFDLATGERRDHRFWRLPEPVDPGSLSVDEYVAEYRRRLERAVHDCETADVEVGLFLSGGIDSAAIAALATTGPHTFSALNASTLSNGDTQASATTR